MASACASWCCQQNALTYGLTFLGQRAAMPFTYLSVKHFDDSTPCDVGYFLADIALSCNLRGSFAA